MRKLSAAKFCAALAWGVSLPAVADYTTRVGIGGQYGSGSVQSAVLVGDAVTQKWSDTSTMIEATRYFTEVNTSGVPLAEAAFLDKSGYLAFANVRHETERTLSTASQGTIGVYPVTTSQAFVSGAGVIGDYLLGAFIAKQTKGGTLSQQKLMAGYYFTNTIAVMASVGVVKANSRADFTGGIKVHGVFNNQWAADVQWDQIGEDFKFTAEGTYYVNNAFGVKPRIGLREVDSERYESFSLFAEAYWQQHQLTVGIRRAEVGRETHDTGIVEYYFHF